MSEISDNTCSRVLPYMETIAENVEETTENLDQTQVKKMIDHLMAAERVFVMGAGRSGLVAKAFAMRLMHLGFSVFVVGESTTPAVRENDVVLAVSGSGETKSVADLGRTAKDIGAKLVTITSNPDSILCGLSNAVIIIQGRTKMHVDDDYMERRMKGDYKSLAPLGTMFEILSMIVLDAVVAELMDRTGASEAELKSRHATLE